jgi:hypothetical protein
LWREVTVKAQAVEQLTKYLMRRREGGREVRVKFKCIYETDKSEN